MEMKPESWKPGICFDFDGTLTQYNGWDGPETCKDLPIPGIRDVLAGLHVDHEVIICSCRAAYPEGKECIERWLKTFGMDRYVDRITDRRPPCLAYVDDRAVTFQGKAEGLTEQIREFRPWYVKEV